MDDTYEYLARRGSTPLPAIQQTAPSDASPVGAFRRYIGEAV